MLIFLRRLCIIALCSMLFCSSDSNAQPVYDLYTQIMRQDMQARNIPFSLPGSRRTVSMDAGLGYGFATGGGIRLPFPGNSFTTRVGLSLLIENAPMQAFEPTTLNIGGRPTQALIRHNADILLTRLVLQPSIEWRFARPLAIYAGVSALYTAGAGYTYTARIDGPDGLQLLTPQILTGKMTAADNAFSISLNLGVAAYFRLNTHWEMSTGIEFSRMPISISSQGTWLMNSAGFRLGFHHTPEQKAVQPENIANPPQPPPREILPALSVRKGFLKVMEESDTVLVYDDTIDEEFTRITADTTIITDSLLRINKRYERRVPRPKALLLARINTAFQNPQGKVQQNAEVEVQEQIIQYTMPLLPYLFFDKDSMMLPARYQSTGIAANIHRNNKMAAYYSLLPLIFQRMRDNPQSKLVLRAMAPDAAGLKRMNNAAAGLLYLFALNGIDPSRISINEKRAVMSGSSAQEYEENTRVELSSQNKSLLAPIVFYDTIRMANPPVIILQPKIVSEAGLDSWTIRILRRDEMLRQWTGTTMPPARIEWRPESEELTSSDTALLQVEIQATDIQGGNTRSISQMRFINKRRSQPHLVYPDREEYTLMYYDVDNTGLPEKALDLLSMIRSRKAPQDSMFVVSITDTLGTEQYNLQLSEKRAREVARFLGLPAGAHKGMGELQQGGPFPEDRFYSRNVQIILRRRTKPN